MGQILSTQTAIEMGDCSIPRVILVHPLKYGTISNIQERIAKTMTSQNTDMLHN